jgi:hypothetical protein
MATQPEKEFWLMLQLLEEKSDVGFQHDGAPPRIYSEVTTLLNTQLPDRWIGRG